MDRIVLEDECRRVTTLSPRERRREHSAGRFPAEILLPDGTVGWLESDLELWANSRRPGALPPLPPRAPRFTPGPPPEAVAGGGTNGRGGGKERRRKAPARVM
jgi:predicted DNA-binding transcriptional regulator AlpA